MPPTKRFSLLGSLVARLEAFASLRDSIVMFIVEVIRGSLVSVTLIVEVPWVLEGKRVRSILGAEFMYFFEESAC